MESNTRKELKVSAIENGTVLDHIPSNQLFKVITFGTNLLSKLLGKKAIIKVADRYFADDEINRIALVAPQAKINIIKNFEVVQKKIISVPKEIEGIVKCGNPKCITNHQPVKTRFSTVMLGNGKFLLHCHYCEKDTMSDNMTIMSNK